jgi:hypothetical protein
MAERRKKVQARHGRRRLRGSLRPLTKNYLVETPLRQEYLGSASGSGGRNSAQCASGSGGRLGHLPLDPEAVASQGGWRDDRRCGAAHRRARPGDRRR